MRIRGELFMADIQHLFRTRGLVTAKDLEEAEIVRRRSGGSLESTLVRLGAVAEAELLGVLADISGLSIATREDLPARQACQQAIERLGIPVPWLVDRQAAPWFETTPDGERLTVLCAAIPDCDLREACEQWHPRPARYVLGASELVEDLLPAAPRDDDPAIDLVSDRLRELAEEAPVIDLVNAIFAEALLRQASDIHIEPFEDRVIVRLRVDGVLSQWRAAPRASIDAIASRLKLLSGMDIAERRLPQDGRQRVRVCGREVDIRVSSLPTRWGESIVLRLMGSAEGLPSLTELGLEADDAARLLTLSEKRNGILLITGPTGSGKTTTVYRLITHLNDGTRKIVTIEDPVEMDIPGVVQMAARPDIGIGFAAGLRSILRQDPDVILIGEIRDGETARIAVQAALTGHLVISTVHTNSAAAAVTRLVDLGVEPFLLAEVVRGLVSQRLVRRVCTDCPQDAASVDCSACGGSGYRGQLGIFEIIAIDPVLQKAIRDGLDADAVTALARGQGNRSIIEDGLAKAARGETALPELHRVYASQEWAAPAR
jgi:general secretion pathway protein E